MMLNGSEHTAVYATVQQASRDHPVRRRCGGDAYMYTIVWNTYANASSFVKICVRLCVYMHVLSLIALDRMHGARVDMCARASAGLSREKNMRARGATGTHALGLHHTERYTLNNLCKLILTWSSRLTLLHAVKRPVIGECSVLCVSARALAQLSDGAGQCAHHARATDAHTKRTRYYTDRACVICCADAGTNRAAHARSCALISQNVCTDNNSRVVVAIAMCTCRGTVSNRYRITNYVRALLRWIKLMTVWWWTQSTHHVWDVSIMFVLPVNSERHTRVLVLPESRPRRPVNQSQSMRYHSVDQT